MTRTSPYFLRRAFAVAALAGNVAVGLEAEMRSPDLGRAIVNRCVLGQRGAQSTPTLAETPAALGALGMHLVKCGQVPGVMLARLF